MASSGKMKARQVNASWLLRFAFELLMRGYWLARGVSALEFGSRGFAGPSHFVGWLDIAVRGAIGIFFLKGAWQRTRAQATVGIRVFSLGSTATLVALLLFSTLGALWLSGPPGSAPVRALADGTHQTIGVALYQFTPAASPSEHSLALVVTDPGRPSAVCYELDRRAPYAWTSRVQALRGDCVVVVNGSIVGSIDADGRVWAQRAEGPKVEIAAFDCRK